MMGVLTYKLGDTVVFVLQVLDIIIQGIFIMDCLLQLYCYRLSFFSDGWKIADLVITVLTCIPLGSISKYSKFARSIRVVRVVRVFSHVKYLRLLLNVLCETLPQVGWTVVIQLILFYCYAVLGTMFFGEQFPDWFGSIWLSFFSLFQVMTLESWSSGIARPVIAVYPSAWVYFVSFVIISSFVLMNIVVGVIVNSMQTTSQRNQLLEYANLGCTEKENQVLFELLGKIYEIENAIQIVVDEKYISSDNSKFDLKENLQTIPSMDVALTPVTSID